jgi:hypothetical protein
VAWLLKSTPVSGTQLACAVPSTRARSFFSCRLGFMSAPSSPSAQKSLWPELINKHCDEVKKVIEAERPDLKLEVRNIADSVPEGIVHTRIRIFCDKEGIVRFIPKVG